MAGLQNFREWRAAQLAAQNRDAHPQPFNNKATLYKYVPRHDGDPTPMRPIASAPPPTPAAPQPIFYAYHPQPIQYYPMPLPAPVAPSAPTPPPPVWWPPGGFSWTHQPIFYPPPTPVAPPAAPAPAHALWYGRTRGEVAEDDAFAVAVGGGQEWNRFRPNGEPNTRYYVLELDGVTQNTYPLAEIDRFGAKGYWNQHQGVNYFVRQRA